MKWEKPKVYFNFLCACLLLWICALLTGCGASPKKYTIMNYEAFDTVSEITAYSTEDQTEHLNALNALLEEWDSLFDIYEEKEIPNLKTVNDCAGKKPVKVDERILSVLRFGLTMEHLTEGRVNMALGSVLSLWHDCRMEAQSGKARLPEQKELLAAAGHTDSSNIMIDEKASTVYLADEKMSLDVGAIAKGCAADALLEKAKELGMDSVMINLGGNLLTLGNKKNTKAGTDWIAGIQDPENMESYLYKIPLNNMALVTSGDYQRFYEVDGKKYSHIIDPETLYPPELYKSVTVYAESSGLADALSTALFIADLEDGKRILSEAGDGCEAVWILQDGTVEYSGKE